MPALPQTARSRRWWALALVAALVTQVLVLYLPAVPEAPGSGVPAGDKVVHATVFAAVTLTGLAARLRPSLVVGFGVVHAVVSEVVQHTLLADRSGDPFDVLADALGVLLGWALARRLASRAARRVTARERRTAPPA
ncbi:VanZ family protein [Georgenia sp. AZ-5]|uniref:VanZ family protein n=1 Tax=Georgenia sp. AZ-5 TaxID=3367526 RepID=UPI0037553D50